MVFVRACKSRSSFVVPVRRLWLGDDCGGGGSGIWLLLLMGAWTEERVWEGHLYQQPAALITRDEKEQT